MVDPFETEFNMPFDEVNKIIQQKRKDAAALPQLVASETVEIEKLSAMSLPSDKLRELAGETNLGMTPAQINDVAIRHLVGKVREGWLQLGGLLKMSYDNGFWSQVGYESWRDYLEELGFEDYSKCMKLIGVAEMVISRNLTAEEVNEIGMSKACLLVPAARQGKLTREIVEMAKSCPNSDLREALGHNLQETDHSNSIECPRCGATINGASWMKKKNE